MKKLKFLALILPVFFAFFIVNNVEAKSACATYKFEERLSQDDSLSNATVSDVTSPRICLSNLDDTGHITDKTTISYTADQPLHETTNLISFKTDNSNKTVKVQCGSTTFLGTFKYCSNNKDGFTLVEDGSQSATNFFGLIGASISKDTNVLNVPIKNLDGTYSKYTYKDQKIDTSDDNVFADMNANGGHSGSPTNPNGDSADNSSNDDQDPEDACYNSGIDSMGWLVCPTIENAKNTIDPIEGLLRIWLQIDPGKVFKTDATDVAWGVFRNIANIFIVILLLFIIFSQVTGYGIDNYGIKKTLPRLIIIAILINLSYVLCRIAVDISNIIGVGITNLFQSIAETIPGDGLAAGMGALVDAILAAIVGTGLVAGTAITIVSTIAGGGGVLIVISLLISIMVALVAIVMFFVMLAVRMILVIFLTIISPLAIACYLLPNTQGLTKKWFNIFKALLVVFPICGALYGASLLIRAIILGGGDVDFFWAMIGVAAPFLPFFALPSLLKEALAGIAAISGALTALGNGVRRGLTSGNQAIQNTDRYKAQEARNRGRRAQKALEHIDKGYKIPGTNRYIGGKDKIGTRIPFGAKNRREDADFRREQYRQEADKYVTQKNVNEIATDAQPLDEAVARQRAESAFDAQEIKNYTDQYTGFSWNDLNNELNGYTDASGNHHAGLAEQLSANPDDHNVQRRFRAAMSVADGMGMTDEMLNALGSTQLNRDNNAQLLGQLAKSKNKAISTYAKQLSKTGNTSSLDQFVQDGGLQAALNEEGSNALVGVDDKTLKYINTQNPHAVSGEMLMKAATNSTTNGKQLNALNQLIAAQGAMNYQLNAKDMANLDESTAQTLVNHGNENVIKHTWRALQVDNDANRQVLNGMNVQTKRYLANKFGTTPPSTT